MHILYTSINPHFMFLLNLFAFPNHSSRYPTPGIPARQPPLISTRMAQSSPAVSPQDLAAGYAALAAAYAQAAAEEEAEGEVPTDLVEGDGDLGWWSIF